MPLPRLDGLDRLVDGAVIAAWIAHHLDLDAVLVARYLRLRQPSRASVLFDVALPGRRTWLVATLLPGRNLRRRVTEGLSRLEEHSSGGVAQLALRAGVGRPLAALADPPVLLEWFPASLSLPGLGLDGAGLAAAFGLNGGEPRPVVYKPERRAVLQWGETFLRAYGGGECFADAARAHKAAAHIGEPFALAPVRQLPGARLLAQARVEGSAPAWSGDVRRQLGRALGRLHATRRADLPRFGAAEHLSAAAASARLASNALPALAHPLDRLLSRMVGRLPAPGDLVVSHGDMHRDQAFGTTAGLRLLDPDWICCADPALDLAAIGAHEITAAGRSYEEAVAELEDVLAGYGSRPRALDWYLAVGLIRGIAAPLSRLDPSWKELTGELVDLASQLLP
ncbi:MAG: phosphotransferase [Acidimicrobiales bacterium]